MRTEPPSLAQALHAVASPACLRASRAMGPHTTVLHLRDAGIDASGTRILAEGLRHAPGIRSLSLSHILEWAEQAPALEMLCVEGNHVSPDMRRKLRALGVRRGITVVA